MESCDIGEEPDIFPNLFSFSLMTLDSYWKLYRFVKWNKISNPLRVSNNFYNGFTGKQEEVQVTTAVKSPVFQYLVYNLTILHKRKEEANGAIIFFY